MEKYKFGDILCFTPSNLIGELIVAIDSKGLGNFSHNAIFWKYEHGLPLFIESHESNSRGVGITKLQESRNNFIVLRSKIETIPERDVLNLLGNKYDAGRILKIIGNRWFGIPVSKDGSDKLICSELVNFVFDYKLLEKGNETPWEIEKLYLSGELELVV